MKHYTIGGALALALLTSTAIAQTDANGVAQIPTVAAQPAATAVCPRSSAGRMYHS